MASYTNLVHKELDDFRVAYYAKGIWPLLYN